MSVGKVTGIKLRASYRSKFGVDEVLGPVLSGVSFKGPMDGNLEYVFEQLEDSSLG